MKLICVHVERQVLTVCAWCSPRSTLDRIGWVLTQANWQLSTGICQDCVPRMLVDAVAAAAGPGGLQASAAAVAAVLNRVA